MKCCRERQRTKSSLAALEDWLWCIGSANAALLIDFSSSQSDAPSVLWKREGASLYCSNSSWSSEVMSVSWSFYEVKPSGIRWEGARPSASIQSPASIQSRFPSSSEGDQRRRNSEVCVPSHLPPKQVGISEKVSFKVTSLMS